ncbi:hypothetical protein EV356DRAFT_532421 [Viridothelium virens]|uniref:Uncharacterized protein n=1 Tax=Viridothelium virens TaxID=1048519 RepID=A0A6A6HA25_VIRVR|nr:hypothetical protein EV356DRAFT_532421 [Viridothelium virens]
MFHTRDLFLCLAAAFAAVSAAPLEARQDSAPATVNIAPYAVVGCQMSENPHSGLKPNDYNVTTGSGCVVPPYSFSSYVEEANSLAATGPCSLSLFSSADCTGPGSAATLTTYYDCIPEGGPWQSLELVCGP